MKIENVVKPTNAMRLLILGLIYVVTTLPTSSEATHCSWDPSEAGLVCSLTNSPLSLTKHQTEATRTLRLICNDETVSTIQVHYDTRRRSKPWPHLIRLEIVKCPLTSVDLKVDGIVWPNKGDVLSDFVRPLIGDLHGLRYISLTDVSSSRSR